MVVQSIEGAPRPAAPKLLHMADFRLMWFGFSLLTVALQFYFVGLIWLVLDVTGSGLLLGTVLTVSSIPRAVGMFLSGGVLDRWSPRRVMLLSGLGSSALVGVIAFMLWGDWLRLPHIFLLVSLLGFIDILYYPILTTLTARLVDRSQLNNANALMQGSDNVANVIGPVVAGLVVGSLGLVQAFTINSALFVLGALLIVLMRHKAATSPPAPAEGEEQLPLARAIMEGIRYAWANPGIRSSVLVLSALNMFGFGPVFVGGALMVETRFGGDATMFGYLTSAYGVGALAGAAMTGLLSKTGHTNRVLAVLCAICGVCMGLFGLSGSFWVAFLLLALMGVCFAIVGVLAVTWLQSQTADHMQGRMAGLMTFAVVAADPISQAASGVLSEISLVLLYALAGFGMLITGLAAWFGPRQA